jgi:hypothetical protein
MILHKFMWRLSFIFVFSASVLTLVFIDVFSFRRHKMNTISKIAPQAFAVTGCRPPSKIGCVIEPVVTQCRPPSKIGCVASAPSVQGEAVKPVISQQVADVPPCGESYYSETGAPDIGLAITMFIAGILGSCR